MNNPTAANGTRPAMDVRQPIAKMRAQADQSRQAEARLRADAQAVIDEAKAEYERIAAKSQAAFNEISLKADAQAAEAVFWDGLAAEHEAKAGLTALDVPASATGEDGGPQE